MQATHTHNLPNGETTTQEVQLPADVAAAANELHGQSYPTPYLEAEVVDDNDGNALAMVYVEEESTYIDFSPTDRNSFPNKGVEFMSRLTNGSIRSQRPIDEIVDLVLVYAGEKELGEDTPKAIRRYARACRAYESGATFEEARQISRGPLLDRLDMEGSVQGFPGCDIKKTYDFRNGITIFTHYDNVVTVAQRDSSSPSNWDARHIPEAYYTPQVQDDLFTQVKNLT